MRAAADGVDAAADGVAGIRSEHLAPDELCGSQVGAAASHEPMAERLNEVVTRLRAWARAARGAADAFERAEVANGQRIAPR
ncbi:DUF7162 family protein [Mycolicibacterium chubuense]|uniref:DUF7162 family protein n=1 Tax=Mycolicibacterium chubuense TaxID=1800 RepID=UPI0003113AF8|nr:hypothetical protein [Mycolicibacterium chubuense]